MKMNDINEKEKFEAVWWPVLNYAIKHQKGFLYGIENYVYPDNLDLTVEYNGHISKVIENEEAYLIYEDGERLYFIWSVDTPSGKIYFSAKNLCLLPDGKVLKFD